MLKVNHNPAVNSNVISLRDKLEVWHSGFIDNENQIEVKISNHGRMLQNLNAKLEDLMGKSSTKR